MLTFFSFKRFRGGRFEMNDSVMEKKLNEKLSFIYAYLLKMGASKEDAEDIIQDTAYKFLLYIDSMNIKNIESWLFRVAIIGVVVTGTPSELKAYQNLQEIRGATIDKY